MSPIRTKLEVAYYFSTIILYFASFVQFSCVCLDVELFKASTRVPVGGRTFLEM